MSAKAKKTAEQTIAANQTIDYRKDPAPTDWLSIRVAKYDDLYVEGPKTEWDYHREFVAKLEGLRCEPVCLNSHAVANGQLTAECRPVASCICSLVEQLTSPDVDLLVPKSEFVAVVQTIGLSEEQALEQYRNYVTNKMGDKYNPEFERLDIESQNAYNWVSELGGKWEALKAHAEVSSERRVAYAQMMQEVEDLVSAS